MTMHNFYILSTNNGMVAMVAEFWHDDLFLMAFTVASNGLGSKKVVIHFDLYWLHATIYFLCILPAGNKNTMNEHWHDNLFLMIWKLSIRVQVPLKVELISVFTLEYASLASTPCCNIFHVQNNDCRFKWFFTTVLVWRFTTKFFLINIILKRKATHNTSIGN